MKAVLSIWVILVVAGFAILARYEAKPGKPADAPVTWPKSSHLLLASDAPTILMAVHPLCSCSIASLTMLKELAQQANSRAHIIVALRDDAENSDAWRQTDAYAIANAIPRVTLYDDKAGAEAIRFGAYTSGQTVLYAADGTLLFAGGITAARGQIGPAAGQAEILDILEKRPPGKETQSVFGCGLRTPSRVI